MEVFSSVTLQRNFKSSVDAIFVHFNLYILKNTKKSDMKDYLNLMPIINYFTVKVEDHSIDMENK